MKKQLLSILFLFTFFLANAQLMQVTGDFSVGETNSKLTGYGSRLHLRGLNDAGVDSVWISRYNNASNQTELRVNVGDDNSGDDKFVVGSTLGYTSWNPWFTISNNGKVGVGVVEPLAKLHISTADSTDAAILATTTAGTKLMVKSLSENTANGASYKLFHRFWSDDRNGYISFHRGGDTYGGFLEFGSNGLERMRIDGSGNVQIGTTNTTGNLSVNGAVTAKEVTVKDPVWADFVFDKNYKLRDLKEVDQYIQENGHLPEIPSTAEVKEKGVNMVEVQAKLLQKVEELTLYTIQLQKEIERLKAAQNR